LCELAHTIDRIARGEAMFRHQEIGFGATLSLSRGVVRRSSPVLNRTDQLAQSCVRHAIPCHHEANKRVLKKLEKTWFAKTNLHG
jgi:hypothetical protein